jgi:hypothetical protein
MVGPGHPRSLSAVLCVVFLLYQPRWEGNKRKRKRKKATSQQARGCLSHCLAVMHYKKII